MVSDFMKMIDEISEIYPELKDNYTHRHIESMINDVFCSIPYEDIFGKSIGTGSFKEVYSLTQNFVIKFVSVLNHTAEEMEIYQKAKEAGVADILVPTWCYMATDEDEFAPLFHLDNDDDDYSECVAIMVQPVIYDIEDNLGYTVFDYSTYEEEPLYDENDDKISFDQLSKWDVYSKSWLDATLRWYGREFFDDMTDFIYTENIGDLHTGNLGYMGIRQADYSIQLKPIILDWMSFHY